MQRYSTLLVLSLLLTSCAAPAEPLAALPADTKAPLGIGKDFMAVYESREGARTADIDVAQSGTGYVLRRKGDEGVTVCDNLDGAAVCRTGTGLLLKEETAQRILQVETTSLRRMLLRERALGDEIKAEPQTIPSTLALFKKSAFSAPFQAHVESVPDTILENCFQKVTTEEKELFCFGGGLMPFWASTTFSDIGNVTLMRALKGYTEKTLTEQQLRSLRASIK